LGSEIKKLAAFYPNYHLIFTDINELDITKYQDVISFCKKNSIQIIINCAAYTAVDNAENEEELANLINYTGAKNLANAAFEINAFLIHISTDYLFDGTKNQPYHEDDKTNPLGVYGKSKEKGERAIVESKARSIIIRTSWLYSEFGKNFVKTILKLAKERKSLNIVYDQVGSPTYAGDLAQAILDIISKDEKQGLQVFHYSNEGAISWYDFAKAINEIDALSCEILPIESKDYPTLAKRPPYSVFNKSKIKSNYHISIPYWRDSLVKCINILKNS
jgi:dTDP-4-dehydrorhamnose reductase